MQLRYMWIFCASNEFAKLHPFRDSRRQGRQILARQHTDASRLAQNPWSIRSGITIMRSTATTCLTTRRHLRCVPSRLARPHRRR